MNLLFEHEFTFVGAAGVRICLHEIQRESGRRVSAQTKNLRATGRRTLIAQYSEPFARSLSAICDLLFATGYVARPQFLEVASVKPTISREQAISMMQRVGAGRVRQKQVQQDIGIERGTKIDLKTEAYEVS